MPIFKNDKKGSLKKLKSIAISKEKEIQTLVENNLLEVLDMHFLATEYTTTFGGRIDTLAVDINGAPVIIEYKKNRSDNIINQGLSYLKWLQAQKVEFFEMIVLKKLGKKLSSEMKIDWKNPRVVCIAESYSKFDIDTVEVIPMRIELFKFRYYEENIFSLEQLGLIEQKSKPITSKVTSNKTNVDHSVEERLKIASSKIKDIYAELRALIFELDENVVERATSFYVAYRVAKNFAEVHIGKNQLKIHLRPIEYNDSQNKIDKIPDGYQWTMNRRIYLKESKDVAYVMKIIEESYKDII